MLNWLWDQITSWGFNYALPVVGGLVMAFLQRHREKWATTALYGLVGAAAIFVAVTASRVQGVLLKEPNITIASAETVTRGWLDVAGISVERKEAFKKDDPEIFRYGIKGPPGYPIDIVQWEEPNQYIFFITNMALSECDSANLNAMDQVQSQLIVSSLRAELAKLNIEFVGVTHPLKKFTIRKMLPITESLTVDQFYDAMQAISNSILVVENAVAVGLIGQSGSCTQPALPGSAQ
jgi:hypothetical protein